MTDKTHHSLPRLPAMPGFVGESSTNDEYVSVLTPDHKVQTPNTASNAFDPNGFRMKEWTVTLDDGDWHTAFYWWVSCCPCFPLAQLETRLGLTKSYPFGLSLGLLAYASRLVLVLLTIIVLLSGKFVSFAICLLLAVFSFVAVGHRVSRVRKHIRDSLEISGSGKNDRTMGCLRSASVIRQMAVQLKCDQIHAGAPATLQAYQV
uniref:Uncharacterized protein n=1 Tax=Hyaloperonospora arabidopsidis (strain Emoy2) TaxID=559515 RepID=M4BGX6_HYAAE